MKGMYVQLGCSDRDLVLIDTCVVRAFLTAFFKLSGTHIGHRHCSSTLSSGNLKEGILGFQGRFIKVTSSIRSIIIGTVTIVPSLR